MSNIISNLRYSGVDNYIGTLAQKRQIFFNTMLLIQVPAAIGFVIMLFAMGMQSEAINLFLMLAVVPLVFGLIRMKKILLARMGLLMFMNVSLFYWAQYFGPEAHINYLYSVYVTLPFLFFPLKNKFGYIGFSVLMSVIGFLVCEFKEAGASTVWAEQTLETFYYIVVAITIIWIVANMIYIISLNDDFESTIIGKNQELGMLLKSEKSNNERLHSQNLELENFAYLTSHDIQEPLRVVSIYTDQLVHDQESIITPESKKHLEYIYDGVHRMKKQMQALMEYSSISKESSFKEINIGDIAKQAVKDLELEPSVSIDANCQVLADANGMYKLMHHLIDNASKFRDPKRPLEINISVSESDNFVAMHVKDNGIGIKKNKFERIFSIFQRLHSAKAYPGIGVGLAFCKKIAASHNGSVQVLSELGRGSEFIVRISKNIDPKINYALHVDDFISAQTPSQLEFTAL